jgi:cell division protein FtsB
MKFRKAQKKSIFNIISSKLIFYVLLFILIVVGGAYVFLVNNVIHNVIARTADVKKTAELSMQVNDLETEYIALENKITIDSAYHRGFKDAVPQKFINRESSLTYNNR